MEKPYIPEVAWKDIIRLLHRNFVHDRIDQLIALIDMYGVREQPRAIAACIKNANGDLRYLCNRLFHAQGYWSEEISRAEPPKLLQRRAIKRTAAAPRT